MATVTETNATTRAELGEHRFVIHNLGWERYEALLEILGDDGPRMNYLRGDLEFMSPLIPHERNKKLLAFIVETLIEELGIPANALGSTTFRRRLADRGLEADECYHIENAGRLTTQLRPDLDVDPPPDLAIEVEITSSLVDKLEIYAGIGVPEVWRFDGETLAILLLGQGARYAESLVSRSFPFLPMAEIARFLGEYESANETAWRRSFRVWVREAILPTYRNPAAPE